MGWIRLNQDVFSCDFCTADEKVIIQTQNNN